MGGGRNGYPKIKRKIAKRISLISIGAVFLLIFLIYNHKQSSNSSKQTNPDSSNNNQVVIQGKETPSFDQNNNNLSQPANPLVLGDLASSPVQQTGTKTVYLNGSFLIDSNQIQFHAIEQTNIDSNSITSRTIKDHTIRGRDINKNTNLTIGKLTTRGDLTVTGTIAGSLSGSFAPTGDVNMASHLLTNIGNAGTDFTALGGLTLAGNLTAPNVVYSVSGSASRLTSTGGQTPVLDIASDYVGQTSLTTLGTIITGSWHGTVIEDGYLASALTGKTYNALTLTANADGFALAGGTVARTLAVTGSNITLTGGGNTLTLSGNAALNQNLRTADAPTFATLNTGQGAYELYAMDQNVLTTSSPTFGGLTLNGNLALGANTITTSNTTVISNLNADMTDGYHLNQNVLTISSPTFGGLTLNGNLVLGANTLTTSNTTLISNLNADYLDGYHETSFALLAGRTGGQTLIGGTGVTDMLKLQGTSGNGTLTSPAIQLLVGNNGATNAMTILNNGNVGVGTTNPGYKLDVNGTAFLNELTLPNNSSILQVPIDSSKSRIQLSMFSSEFAGDKDPAFVLGYNCYQGNKANHPALCLGLEGYYNAGGGNIWTETYFERYDTDGTTYRPFFLGARDGYAYTMNYVDQFEISNKTGRRLLIGYSESRYVDIFGKLQLKQVGGQTDPVQTWIDYTGTTTATMSGYGYLGIGIGDTAPAERVEINGNIKISATGGYLLFGNSGGSWGPSKIWPATGNFMAMSGYGGAQLGGYNGSAYGPRLTVLGTGNVGIGTTNPIALLNISDGDILVTNLYPGAGNIPPTRSIMMDAITSVYEHVAQTGMKAIFGRLGDTDYSSRLAFFTAADNISAESMRIDQYGNVGIGTTNPGSHLEVAQTRASDVTPLTIKTIGAITDGDINRLAFRSVTSLDGTYRSIATVNGISTTLGGNSIFGSLSFSVNNVGTLSEAMRIKYNGNVGIGTTAPGNKLSVSGGVGIGTTAPGSLYLSTAAPDGGMIVENRIGIGTTAPVQALDVTGKIRYTVEDTDATNNYVCYNTTNKTLSDCTSLRKYKDNITPLTLGLETVMQLNPVTYRVKQNGETTLGFIAEDVEAVNPILATYDANGQLTGVKMPQLTAVLTKAVQEQQLQIVNHESRIMNQDTLLSTITLKLDDNATTVDGLKTSMNSQLSIIGSSVNGLEIKLSSVIGHQSSTDSQISDLTVQTQHLASLQATIQTQMTDIKTQNQAILDFFTVLNPETLVTKDALGNVDLLKGKLEADGIVARAFTVKVVDQEAKTIGEAKIVPVKDIEDADNDGFDDKTNSKGGEIVVVKTKAVSDSAKIFVTSETGNPVIWSISKKKNGESFTIKLSEPTSEEVKFNWWIVEMKE